MLRRSIVCAARDPGSCIIPAQMSRSRQSVQYKRASDHPTAHRAFIPTSRRTSNRLYLDTDSPVGITDFVSRTGKDDSRGRPPIRYAQKRILAAVANHARHCPLIATNCKGNFPL